MAKQPSFPAIAVIGMACHYPGARDLKNFWENILARRRQFRLMPDQRLPLSDYYDPDPATPDKTYGDKAALIDGFHFDWIGHRIPRSAYQSSDITHWLALDVALQALVNSRYTMKSVPHDRSGVILGNTLTGEHSRAEGLRLRWPFVKRTLMVSAKAKGLSLRQTEGLVRTMESYYKSVFSPITEDSLSGGLSNTIAGRICNFFDWHGGGYTVDGACSSSLVAVATAATSLSNGDLDLALAGGVDISLDTFELIGFAKTSALTKTDMHVYDQRANGFIPGEGCGFVVLKRLDDALADGNYIYAVLRGWGISSDGKGGLTAPNVKGQAMALQRAYEKAGYSIDQVDFIEGHGTGTPVGDRVELEAISMVMGQKEGKGSLRSCGITSLKSIIGHTKAASGIGGFIKAVISVNRRILPPTANCNNPNHIFEHSARLIYPLSEGKIIHSQDKLKAGVSAMGFGGINCHVTIESGSEPAEDLAPALEEYKVLATKQETELFVLDAPSPPSLLERTSAIKDLARGMCEGELIDLAVKLAQELNPGASVRAAFVAESPAGVLGCLDELEKCLKEKSLPPGNEIINPTGKFFIGNSVKKDRIGFIFPGQGSQQLNMAKMLVARHHWAENLAKHADYLLGEKHSYQNITRFIFKPLDRATSGEQVDKWSALLRQTEIAQPAICLSSLIWYRRLLRLGIKPSAVAGHSLGELTAFHAAGAFDQDTLLELAALRGQVMSTAGGQQGTMAALACSRTTAEKILRKVNGYAVIANINSPTQVVIAGEKSSIEEAVGIAGQKEIKTHVLNVSNAFHSNFVSAAAASLRRESPVDGILEATTTKLISCVRGENIEPGLNLREHFVDQIVSQVNFVALVETLAPECDLMLEVGPGRILSNLVNDILGGNHEVCRPVESKAGTDRDLNLFLANYFIYGGNINWQTLFEDRFFRPFVPASKKTFITNPCERPYNVSSPAERQDHNRETGSLESILTDVIDLPPRKLADYFSQRRGFIQAVIKADLENLPTGTVLPVDMQAPEKQPSTHPTTASSKNQPGEPSSQGRPTVLVPDLLLEVVAKHTGFPQESLTMELRLLDDLNLDSIKASELIAEASIQLGVAGELDVSQFANATLAEIAAALDQLENKQEKIPAPRANNGAGAGRPTWVRNFVVRLEKEKIPNVKRNRHELWRAERIAILFETMEKPFAAALCKQLIEFDSEAQLVPYNDVKKLTAADLKSFSGFIGILPRLSNGKRPRKNRLARMIKRLRTLAILPPKEQNGAGRKTVTFVQFGSGYFGNMPQVPAVGRCTSLALAASLHFERPDLKIRVIDFSPRITPVQLADKTLQEIETPEDYAAVGYDQKMVRRIPQLQFQKPADYISRSLSWSHADVILVTGGAKGITAECSLALARATGVRMALVGSSPHPDRNRPASPGDEISKTLKRFSDKGLTCRYYQCDIVDGQAVKNS